MRLIFDMNLTPRWVQYLVNANHESVHWSDIGPHTADDSAICDYARRNGFVIVTNGFSRTFRAGVVARNDSKH
jgi:predicted nuclease of predicted toxin-antitoxin system